MDQSLELYAEQIESRGILVVRDYALGLPPVAGDAEHLYQALTNLVTNAVDAMGAPGVDDGRGGGRGTLTVRVSWPDGDEARGRRDLLRIEVEDTGAGIAPAEVTSVFNPFFTTKASGTGLGLAIAHKIIEDHGGTIALRSVPGRGTTFTVLLPREPGYQAGRRLAAESAREAQAP